MTARNGLIALIVILAMADCISFGIDPVASPETMLQDIQLFRMIEETAAALIPHETTSEFLVGESIFSYVLIRNIDTETRVRWRWYDGNSHLVRDTGPIVVNRDRQALESISAYDAFGPCPTPGSGPGLVAFYLNGKLVAIKHFRILDRRRNSSLFGNSPRDQRRTLGREAPRGGAVSIPTSSK
jgi:hypothetical protein